MKDEYIKEKLKKIGEPNIPKKRMEPMKNDVILANGMSRNQVMKDPELRKLYYESITENIEAKKKKTDQEKLREVLDKRKNNGRKS